MAVTQLLPKLLPSRLVYTAQNAPKKVALFYLICLTIAELATTYVSPLFGAILHTSILLLILLHSSFLSEGDLSKMLISLLLLPQIRLVSLSLPLFVFDLDNWYLVVSIPLLTAAYVVMRLLGYSFYQVGFRLRMPLYQIGIIAVGVVFGVAEYLILQPQPIVTSTTTEAILTASLSLLIGTGLMEELIFRGIIQQASESQLGERGSILFVAALFVIMHIGWQSLIDLCFVFIAGMVWGYVFMKTRSIVGLVCSHAITNFLLFIVLPLVMAN